MTRKTEVLRPFRSEDDLQRAFHDVGEARELGAVARKVQDAFVKGWPDCTTVRGGVVCFVELKHVRLRDRRAGDGRFKTGLSADQRVTLRDIGRAGGRAYMLISVECREQAQDPGSCAVMVLVPWRALPSTDALVSELDLELAACWRGPATLDGVRQVFENVLWRALV